MTCATLPTLVIVPFKNLLANSWPAWAAIVGMATPPARIARARPPLRSILLKALAIAKVKPPAAFPLWARELRTAPITLKNFVAVGPIVWIRKAGCVLRLPLSVTVKAAKLTTFTRQGNMIPLAFKLLATYRAANHLTGAAIGLSTGARAIPWNSIVTIFKALKWLPTT